ncbi:MAG TPA: hypothetical protein VFV58_34785 [Blastocatellia bacterium]|nr:hypothetical protein [Blastocatellia bacterium]
MRRGSTLSTTNKAPALKEGINTRAIEAVSELGLTEPMRLAALEIAQNWNYDEAAERAGVLPEIVRGWTLDPAFVIAIGYVVIGLADNGE